MSKPVYVSSLMDGRMRLRHSVFATEDGCKKATEVLTKHKRVREVRSGSGSLLVFFEPTLKASTLCRELEAEFPELRKAAEEQQRPRETLEALLGISTRKLEVRILLALLGFSALLGFVNSKAHVSTAAAALFLTARHVWMRRQLL